MTTDEFRKVMAERGFDNESIEMWVESAKSIEKWAEYSWFKPDDIEKTLKMIAEANLYPIQY